MRRLTALSISLLAAAAAGAVSEPLPPLRWERVARPDPGDVVGALALDAAGARLALGGEHGVRVVGAAQRLELTRGPVRDLVFLADAALLVATDDGLFRIEPDGRHTRESLGPGEEARRVSRLASAAGVVAAATSAGVRLRDRAGRWSRSAALPLGAASFVALRERGVDVELWSVQEGALWVSAFPAAAPEQTRFALRVALPVVGDAGTPIDALFDLPEAEVALLMTNGFAVRGSDASWSMLRASWPPGATPLRVGSARGLRVLATDAGLLLATQLAGPWQRAAAPLGSDAVLALAAARDELVVATRLEVLRAAGLPLSAATLDASAPQNAVVEPSPGAPAPTPAPLPPLGPDVRAVQRAALEYLELGPELADSLRARAGRRGWLPILTVRGGLGRDDSHGRAYDQSFVSGALRDLYDSDRETSDDYHVEASVAWDLGDVVFNPDEVDVSRELRSVIALRDDVLDEVTQTCFERRRTLADLAGRDASDPEAAALRLRAAELAAGIDAWTGGWYTRALHGPDTPSTGGSK